MAKMPAADSRKIHFVAVSSRHLSALSFFPFLSFCRSVVLFYLSFCRYLRVSSVSLYFIPSSILFSISLSSFALLSASLAFLLISRIPFSHFLSVISSIVRDEIATCCEAAYDTLPRADLAKLLYLENVDAVDDTISSVRGGVFERLERERIIRDRGG